MQSARDAAYAAQILRIRALIEAFVQARFAAGAYRDADLSKFLTQVVPVVLAGRRQVSALTDAHLSQVIAAQSGLPVRPAGPVDTALLRGVDPAEVYARPYKTVWWKLSEGLALEAAVSAARARLSDVVLSDLQLAKTTTAQHTMRSHDVTRYRRVLGSGAHCDLCPAAAQNTYSTSELMPIHPHCNCGVEPIWGDAEVGAPMNGVVVHEHGELGPVLAVAGQHFDGPSVV